MRRIGVLFLLVLLLGTTGSSAEPEATQPSSPDWSMNATIIEACSCPMFCQCYFNTKPAAHGGHGHGNGEHFCRFNNAFKVNGGSFGDISLEGAKFWVAGDLGDDFSDGEMAWATLTFDPSVMPEQRDAITTILGRLYPVRWTSFTIAPDAAMEWNATNDEAIARLDGGRTAEVVLRRSGSAMTEEPMVLTNLKYWGAPRNDGFVLMPNEVEAYRAGEKPFEFRGTNGFMITFDIASSDIR